MTSVERHKDLFDVPQRLNLCTPVVSTMNRRTVIGAICAIGPSLGGCMGNSAVPVESTEVSPSETPPPTDTAHSAVDVPPCPERPDSFTEENVVRFAAAFEESYVTRLTLRKDQHRRFISISVDADESGADVESTEEGWLVRVPTIGPATVSRVNETETRHGDPPMYIANYLITEGKVVRARGTENVDPQETGYTVSCPPE